MAKISELAPIEAIDGTETVPIVKDGVTGRASLSSLILGSLAPAVELAENAAALAAGYASSTEANLTVARDVEHERALDLWQAFTFPAFATNASYNLFNDSTGTGTNWSNMAGYTTPKTMFETLRTGTATVTVRGVSGQSSTEMKTLQFDPLSAGNKALTAIVHTIGLNDTLTTGAYFSKNFAASDITLGNVRAVQQGVRDAGGLGAVVFAPPTEIKRHAGFSFAADYRYYRRKARRNYADGGVGPYFVDTPRLFEATAQRSGPDRYALDFHRLDMVPSLCGGTNTGNQIVPNARLPILSFATDPATGGYEMGQVIFVGTAQSGDWKRLENVAGVPSWVTCNVKHFNEFAGLANMRRAHQLIAVLEGRGPPVMTFWQCPAAQDVAAGATIATIPIASNSAQAVSTVGKVEIVAGDPQGCFAISNGGVLARTTRGALVRNQTMKLLVRTWGSGMIPTYTLSWVDVFITEPGTDHVPRPITIVAPGVRFVGMEGNQIAPTRKFAFAMGLSFAEIASNPYLLSFTSEAAPAGGGSAARCYLQLVGGSARPQFYIYNTAGTAILNAQAVAYNHASGLGRTVSLNTRYTLFGGVDLTNGTVQLYLSDVDFKFSGGNASLTYTNEDIDWNEMLPGFLALLGPNVNNASSFPFTGKFYGCAWWDDFIDWSILANRRVYMNADGSHTSGAFRAAVDGKTPKFAIVGDKPKLEFGDPGYTDGGGPTKLSWTVSGLLGSMAQDLAG